MATDRVEQCHEVSATAFDPASALQVLRRWAKRYSSPWEIQIFSEKFCDFFGIWETAFGSEIWETKLEGIEIWETVGSCLKKLTHVDTERNTERTVGLKWKPMPVGLYWCDENGKGLAQKNQLTRASFFFSYWMAELCLLNPLGMAGESNHINHIPVGSVECQYLIYSNLPFMDVSSWCSGAVVLSVVFLSD